MTDYTTNRNLPFPEGQDPVAVPADVEGLAKKADVEIEKVDAKYAQLPNEVAQQRAVIQEHSDTLEPVDRTPDNQWIIADRAGRVAWRVDRQGRTHIGDTVFEQAVRTPYRITDKHGRVAFEIDAQGRTHIYDLVGGQGRGQEITSWHVFLAAGQSNMTGPGEKIPDIDLPDPRILQFGASRRVLEPAPVPLDHHQDTSNHGLSPATVFAREYLRHMPSDIGVILVPAAHGGTTLTEDTDKLTWLPGAATDPALDLYAKSVAQTQAALTAAGPQAALKGVLWHQGEGNDGQQAEQFATYMDTLISSYRNDLGVPDLPIIIGQMQREGIERSTWRPEIDRVHSEIPGHTTRTAFAPVRHGLSRYQDTTHFSRTGVEALGASMQRAYPAALRNIPEAQPMAPVEVTAARSGDQITLEWEQPPCRVTGYRIEHSPNGTEWTPVNRDVPMRLHETFTVPTGGVHLRLITEADTLESLPYLISL